MLVDPALRTVASHHTLRPVELRSTSFDPIFLEALERLDAPGPPSVGWEVGPRRRPVSIRSISLDVGAVPEQVPCARCAQTVLVSGPTGHLGDDPICDACLLDADEFLGMVVLLSSISRGFGRVEPSGVEEERSTARQLLSFARLYARFAERRGPGRPPLATDD